jgi:hypothetical protein
VGSKIDRVRSHLFGRVGRRRISPILEFVTSQTAAVDGTSDFAQPFVSLS